MALQTPVFRTTAQNCAKSTINISARPRRRLGYYNMKAKQTHTAILTQYLDFLYEVQKYEKILHEVDILSEKLDNPLVSILSEILTNL